MDPIALIGAVADQIQKQNGDVTIEERIESTSFTLGQRSIDLFDNNGRVFAQGTGLQPLDPMPGQQYDDTSVAWFKSLVLKQLEP